MKLSPENRALIERECGAKLFEDGFEQRGARFYPENLNDLLNVAREEGRKIGHGEAGPRGREFPNGYE